jgi:Holliday junction resolvasome RuvABC endonuclease subunit
MPKINIELIQEELAQKGWKLLSKEYTNLKEELIFECPEGHTVYQSWGKLRTKYECPICKANPFKDQNIQVVPKKKNSTRVLSLDQATHTCGWAIFDDCKLQKFGIFSTNLSEEIERDHAIKTWLLSVISNWKPDIIALEGIQFQTSVDGKQHSMGVTTFETLARLQGILMEACFEQNIQFYICPTNTWRKYCGVKGRTRTDRKRSMQNLAKEWYDVSVSDDIADAVGIGHYASNTYAKIPKIIEWE